MDHLNASLGDPLPTGQSIRIAFLHLAPRYDDVQYNLTLLENLFLQAVEAQANLILTPELAVSGYEFYRVLGKEWIRTEGQSIIDRFSRLSCENHTALILGCPIYDENSAKYHNAAVFFDESGQVVGTHRKILTLPGSIEGWSEPGENVQPVAWRDQKVGLLICADAYRESLAHELAEKGANVLISLAAWAPGMHGPNGEWEKCSKETGLSFYVCNRTGQGAVLNFEGSTSVVTVDGRRAITYDDIAPAVLTIDVDVNGWLPQNAGFSVLR